MVDNTTVTVGILVATARLDAAERDFFYNEKA